jgi:L-malate glycosyltransferase
MRVLCITSSFPSQLNTIAGNFVETQVKSLRKKGVTVDVIAANMFSFTQAANWIWNKLSIFFNPQQENYSAFSIINLWPFNSAFHRVWFRKTIANAVEKYLATNGAPDLIHAHFSLWAGFAISQDRHSASIPLVLTEHSSDFYENRISARNLQNAAMAFKKANSIIVPSNFLKETLVNLFPLAESKISIIPNIVEDLYFNKYNYTLKENIILSIGRLVPSKGFDTLISAFNILSCKNEFKLVIVGDGEQLSNLRQLVKELNLGGKVIFTGTLSRTSVCDWIKRSKIVVSSSHFETFGLTIAEALSTGTPVLVTDVGAPAGFVLPFTGEICRVGDVNHTQEKLTQMLEQYSGYDMDTIREYAKSQFSEDSVCNQLTALYSKVMIRN